MVFTAGPFYFIFAFSPCAFSWHRLHQHSIAFHNCLSRYQRWRRTEIPGRRRREIENTLYEDGDGMVGNIIKKQKGASPNCILQQTHSLCEESRLCDNIGLT